MKKALTLLLLSGALSALQAEPPPGEQWRLVFSDEFDYPDERLEEEWISQNGPSGHILSSRWRENAVVEGGVLKLLARKEARGGQQWTSGNVWTKKLFKYGYYECRYKYAAATGTNNSFWLMTQAWQKLPEGVKRFEIDVNEGHYPDEINMNLHNHSDRWKDPQTGKWRHNAWGKSVCLSPASGRPDRTARPDAPVCADKIRFSSKEAGYFHLRELRIFPPSPDGKYPSVFEDKMPEKFAALENFARGAKISAHSGVYERHPARRAECAIDGRVKTSWLAAPVEEKFLEIDLGQMRDIGCVQILTGWDRSDGVYRNYIHEYKLEYWDGSAWRALFEQKSDRVYEADLSKDFHTYGLLWNEDWLVYYFDGREIHRRKNDTAHWESPVWLSLAITHGAGAVTDKTDGAAMVVDYVKVWQGEGKINCRDRAPGE